MHNTLRKRFLNSCSESLKSKIKNLKWGGIVAIGVTFAMCGAVAEAQQPEKVPRIGFLSASSPSAQNLLLEAFRQGLRDLGYVVGQNVALEIRAADGKYDRLPDLAAELVRLKVDVIFAASAPAIKAAKQATGIIPIVFETLSDPVADGFVANLARPGGNLTGLADPVALGLVDSFANPGGRLTGVHAQIGDLTAKRLEILKEILPKLRRVVTFYDPANAVAREASGSGREAARRLQVEFVERHVASVKELQEGVRALRAGEVDAYFEVSDAMVVSQAQLIIDTARAKRLPTMFLEQSQVVKGGLASYGVSFHEAGRLSAKYVQRILAGVKPKDLPVQGVDKVDLVINLQTAKQIGLTIPPNVLVRADRVIK